MGLANRTPAQEVEPGLSPARFPVATPNEAWKLLPRENPPLPDWALVLVETLPKTTGAMLELDHLHRLENPLGVVWAGRLRWVAADALGCEYARQYAVADLQAAGLSDDEISDLARGGAWLSEGERSLLRLARRLTIAAHEVTDEEMAGALTLLNPEQLVALVHTVAFANFQNRIFLALGVEVGEQGPVPARHYGLDRRLRAEVSTPERVPWDELRSQASPSTDVRGADWSQRAFAELEEALDLQRARQPRLPPPPPERLEGLPPEVLKRSGRIVWSRLSMGYQPRMTMAWFDCMSTFQSESKLDRIFSNSLFWVITRANNCFY